MRMWVVPRLINRPVDELFHQRDFLFNQFIKEEQNEKLWWHYSLSTSIQTLTNQLFYKGDLNYEVN